MSCNLNPGLKIQDAGHKFPRRLESSIRDLCKPVNNLNNLNSGLMVCFKWQAPSKGEIIGFML